MKRDAAPLAVNPGSLFASDSMTQSVAQLIEPSSCLPVARRNHITQGESLNDIQGALQSSKRYLDNKSTMAMEVVCDVDSMADASNHQMSKKVRHKELQEILKPLAHYFLLKMDLMQKVCTDAAQLTNLAKLLRQAKGKNAEQAIIEQMEVLDVDDKYLAFTTKDLDLQHQFIAAASYSDAWSQVYDSQGKCIGAFLSWYICMGNTREGTAAKNWVKKACCRVLASKDRHIAISSDPLAPAQQWYCSCGQHYVASWGQLVQIKWTNAAGQAEDLYMRADCPNWDVEDVRAAWMEQEFEAKGDTPMDLFEKVPRIVPAISSLVIEDPTCPGSVMVKSKADFDALPIFSWWELFGIMGLKPQDNTGALRLLQ